MEVTPIQLMEQIPSIGTCERLEPIHKGYSPQLKYKAVRASGVDWLLRVAPIDLYERMKAEFNVIQTLHGYHVQVPQPIEVGVLGALDLSYYILTYIPGDDAQDVLPQLPDEAQYQIGVSAGHDLKRMHSLRTPSVIRPWSERCAQKYKKYVAAYHDFGVTLKNDDRILSFVEENCVWMVDRPSVFQHDDFHVGNIIVQENKYSGVIDFNRFDWGDPFHDFVKVAMFSREVSLPFSIGQLEGYFQGAKIPDEFWRLYALYVAMTIISSIVWTLRVVPHELDEMIERLSRVMDDHENFQSCRPTWFCTSPGVES